MESERMADIIQEMRMARPVFPFAYEIGRKDEPAEFDADGLMVKPRSIVIEKVTIETLADRIEKAWELEKPQLIGNAAAMREALCALQARFEKNAMAYQDRYFKFTGWHWRKKAEEAKRWRDVFSELNDQCKAALSAPPRNCDRFNSGDWNQDVEEASLAWDGFSAEHYKPDMPVMPKVPHTFLSWLFAPAAEGGAE